MDDGTEHSDGRIATGAEAFLADLASRRYSRRTIDVYRQAIRDFDRLLRDDGAVSGLMLRARGRFDLARAPRAADFDPASSNVRHHPEDAMGNDRTRPDSSLARAHAALEEEHRSLRGLVGRLREVQDAVALVALLDDLHGKLKAHFEREEFPGGLYESMGALGPQHAAQVGELVDQHFRFLSSLRSLAAAAREATAAATAPLLTDAAAFAERLRAHEAAEHRLAEEILAAQ